MAHAQKPDFVFRRNGRVHLNRRGRQFSRLLAAEVLASAVVMLDTPCSEVVWRVLATHCIRQFPLHFPSRASPCAITFELDSISGSKCGRHVRPSPGFFSVTIEIIKIWGFHSGTAGRSVLPGCRVVWSGKQLWVFRRALVPSGPSCRENGAWAALSWRCGHYGT